MPEDGQSQSGGTMDYGRAFFSSGFSWQISLAKPRQRQGYPGCIAHNKTETGKNPRQA